MSVKIKSAVSAVGVVTGKGNREIADARYARRDNLAIRLKDDGECSIRTAEVGDDPAAIAEGSVETAVAVITDD
jgi:hypothetical protein